MMIEVRKNEDVYKAFYFKDIDQEEVAEIVGMGVGKILRVDIDWVGERSHLFIRNGEYCENLCDGNIIDQVPKLQNVQEGHWIVVESKINDEGDITHKAKIVKSNMMRKKYRALLKNAVIVLEGIEIQHELFEEAE